MFATDEFLFLSVIFPLLPSLWIICNLSLPPLFAPTLIWVPSASLAAVEFTPKQPVTQMRLMAGFGPPAAARQGQPRSFCWALTRALWKPLGLLLLQPCRHPAVKKRGPGAAPGALWSTNSVVRGTTWGWATGLCQDTFCINFTWENYCRTSIRSRLKLLVHPRSQKKIPR